MIKKIPYSEIDFDKYERCLENSAQRKYSATKVFLDTTSNCQWDLLLYGDYEAVMPIPYVKKLGFKIVVNSKLCQQLGIFSKLDDNEMNDEFLTFFEKNCLIAYYAFNDLNKFSKKLKQRKNYIISIGSYDVVYGRYSPKRKRKLRLEEDVLKASKIVEVNYEKVSKFINLNFLGAKNEKVKQNYLQIFKKLEEKKLLKNYAFVYNEKIINVICLLVEERTAVLLGSFNDKDFLKISGSSVLIDYAISEYIEFKNFDFEGSEILAIEEFFRGFRPELKFYQVIQNSKKSVIKKAIKFL